MIAADGTVAVTIPSHWKELVTAPKPLLSAAELYDSPEDVIVETSKRPNSRYLPVQSSFTASSMMASMLLAVWTARTVVVASTPTWALQKTSRAGVEGSL